MPGNLAAVFKECVVLHQEDLQGQICQCLWYMWYEISWYTYHEKRTSRGQ
jgi:hypothetical protein